jgi:hypothetical protein
MTKAQVKWMEAYMKPLKDLGLIEPEEERRQWCFHIMVSGAYSDWRMTHMLAAHTGSGDDTLHEITTIGLPEVETVSAQQPPLSQ